MRSTSLFRFVRAGAGLALAVAAAASAAVAKPAPNRGTQSRPINLFASSGLLFEVNRQQCGLQNDGQTCVAFAGSPVGGGGFWPKGTPDQYIYNSGLQIGGHVSRSAGFSWAGDTVGAYFMDARGDQFSGSGLTGWYNALNPDDIATWPNGAIVRDASDSIYNRIIAVQTPKTISQGDAWVRYWEGDPAFLTGRPHPAGILVDQRALAWNFPSGNEDIIYFVFTFYNVTARSSSGLYNNPTIPAAIQSEIADIGDQFQNLNENKFKVAIPDGGFTLDSLYVAFTMDADVANFSANYATAFLPFNIGSIYAGDFLPSAGWTFPPDIFGPPFFAGPGFIGVKYLKSPERSPGVQVGLTMFSQTLNAATALRDPIGVNQLLRYLSGFIAPPDNPCTFTDPAVARLRRLCFLGQAQGDARFFQASGPFNLAPGRASSIVVAYINAAPVHAAGVDALIGGNPGVQPQIPFTGDSIFADPTKVRLIDRIAGWAGQTDRNGNSIIEQNEVTTVPGSLLNKALVAQDVFDKGFLLPSSPSSPPFFLVPGDNQVTVVWQKSPSEAAGDPFFSIANDPTSALYDPNFRQFDVEGYRVYRGRTSSNLELLAQFDYGGTVYNDFTGALDYGDLDGDGLTRCAPELGIENDCPVDFLGGQSFPTDLSGNIVQVAPGGRAELTTGNVIILAGKADTAVVGGGSGFPGLTNSGVPYAYVDRSVRNSFTYFYTVTAFDLNSFKSGPTSLESPRVTKSVTPRRESGQEAGATISDPLLLGTDGTQLNPGAALPALSAANATFAGPMPPTNGFVTSLAVFAQQLVGGGTVTITIDSVVPGHANEGDGVAKVLPTLYYLSAAGPTGTSKAVIPLQVDGFSGAASNIAYVPVTALDAAKSAPFGGSASYSLSSSVILSSAGTYRLTSWGRGSINSDPSRSDQNGPRWWAGAANENTNKPNELVCSPAAGTCVQADLSRNAGAIAGVGIFHVQSYSTVNSLWQRDVEAVLSGVTRAADFKVYWGTNGAIDSVIDVTHHVPVPFKSKIRASWGILNGASFAGTNAALTDDGNNGLLTWVDSWCVDPVPTIMDDIAVCGGAAQTPAVLMNHAELSPVAFQSFHALNGPYPTAATGNGFIFYLNGHFFVMQMAALPAAGTVWNARFYSGRVRQSTDFTTYSFAGSTRPPAVPGLRARFTFQGSTFDFSKANDSLLALVHTVPDPYYVTDALEVTANAKILKFVNLPARALIRIYSLSGVLVQLISVADPTGGAEATWNLRNRNNQFVASGVYFYQVETPDGKSKVGRFTIVNFAP